jgi:alpha-tubulin suppressor-like RCC1 family protein
MTNSNEIKFKKLVIKDHKFQRVKCGWDVIGAFTIDNQLLVWGNNKSNQLGLSEKTIIREPVKLTPPDESDLIIEISFGLKHSAVLTKSHQIFVFGVTKFQFNNTSYSITEVKHNSIVWLKLLSPSTTSSFACGQNHISFVHDSRKICAFGRDNKYGQCSEIEMLKEDDDEIVKLECGWSFNAFLTKSKRLYLYGRNNYGQLGNGLKEESGNCKPHKCPIFPVDDFKCGAEHCIVMSNNKIYTFGWNEHRNTGFDTDDDM